MTNTQHPTADTPVSIRLSKSVPEHILKDDETICSASTDSSDNRLLESDADPLSEASIHLCPDCADEWVDEETALNRAETVRCMCDRIEDGTAYRCGTVVTATEARALKHPDTEEAYVAVCPSCYEWLRNLPTTSVSLSYEDAKPFSER